MPNTSKPKRKKRSTAKAGPNTPEPEQQSRDNWATGLHLIETALDQQIPRDDLGLFLLFANTKDHYLASSDLEAFRQRICPDGRSFVLSDHLLVGYKRPITTMDLACVPEAERVHMCHRGELGLAPAGLEVSVKVVGSAEGENTDDALLNQFAKGLYPEHQHAGQPLSVITIPTLDAPDRAVFLSANPRATDTSAAEFLAVVPPPDDATWYVFDCRAVATCPACLPAYEWQQLEDGVRTALAGIDAFVAGDEAPPAVVDYLGSFGTWPWPLILLYITATGKHPMLNVHLADVAMIARARPEWASVGAHYVVSFGSDLRSTIRYGLEVLRDLDDVRQDLAKHKDRGDEQGRTRPKAWKRSLVSDWLRTELPKCVKAAKDHAYSLKDTGGVPELLPRPTQKDLVERAGKTLQMNVSETMVSNILKDKGLRAIYEGLGNLDTIMRRESRAGDRQCPSCEERHSYRCPEADCPAAEDGRCETCHKEVVHDDMTKEE